MQIEKLEHIKFERIYEKQIDIARQGHKGQ